MSQIILCYDFSAEHTSDAAEKIGTALSYTFPVHVLDIFHAIPESFLGGDVVISVASTWHDGQLPQAWNESVPMLQTVSFSGKKIAFCGIGNGDEYPDFFCDAIGFLADIFEKNGGKLIGETPAEDYHFHRSVAKRGDKIVGLCLDYQKHRDKIDAQVSAWCEELKKQIES